MSMRTELFTSLPAPSNTSRDSGRSDPDSPRSSIAPGRVTTDDPVLQKRYRDLTRKHLSGTLDRLFTEFTGLHIHVAWAPSPRHEWNARDLPTDGPVCRRLAGRSAKTRAYCTTCGLKQLARTLGSKGGGHRFVCRIGVRNHWFPVQVLGVTVGIAYLQARDQADGNSPARRGSDRAGTIRLNRWQFERASRLLQLIVRHVQTLELAELRGVDLTKAKHAVTSLEREQARLHKELGRTISLPVNMALVANAETRLEQVVGRLRQCVHQNYCQPITLRRCALKLAMNAAYLSALFSRAVGMPFKTYLTEVRMVKARELLGDPARSISEIAGAVGYTSANRFRSAFKKVTGLSPRAWRETFRAGIRISRG